MENIHGTSNTHMHKQLRSSVDVRDKVANLKRERERERGGEKKGKVQVTTHQTTKQSHKTVM